MDLGTKADGSLSRIVLDAAVIAKGRRATVSSAAERATVEFLWELLVARFRLIGEHFQLTHGLASLDLTTRVRCDVAFDHLHPVIRRCSRSDGRVPREREIGRDA